VSDSRHLIGVVNQVCGIGSLSLDVQAPVNICVNNDSLQRVYDGTGRPCWSRHIVAMERAAINNNNIHIVRFIILASFAVVTTSLLYGWEDHPHQLLPQL